MKRALICILLLIPAILAWCQPMWPEEAIVRDGQDLHHYEAPICDSSGNVLNSWVKTTGNKHLIYAALSLPDGTAIWDDPLLVKTCDTPANDIQLLATSDNCFIISWLEVASPEGNYIHLQKIDSTGLTLWERRISAALERVVVTYHYKVAANNIGAAYVFFHEINRNHLYGRCLSSAGDEIWGEDAPHITAAGRLTLNGIASSSDYGVAVHYTSTSNASHYLARYSDLGSLEWQQTYLSEDGENDIPHDIFLTADHKIFDVAKIRTTNHRLKIRVFDSTGTELMNPAYELVLNLQAIYDMDYDVCLNGQNLNVVFQKKFQGQNEILYYRVDSMANQAYPAGGLLLGATNASIGNLNICADSAMNAFCSWIEEDTYSQVLKANAVNSDLQAAWGDDGIILCTGIKSSGHQSIVGSAAMLTAIYDVNETSYIKLNKQVISLSSTPIYPPRVKTIASAWSGYAYPVASHKMGDRVLVLYKNTNLESQSALFYQIIDSGGEPVLPRPVQMGSYSGLRDYISSCEMDNNRVALAYDDGGVFLQIINYEGDQCLAEPGLPICNSHSGGFVLSFYNGDLYFGWTEHIGHDYMRLLGQRYSNGQMCWGDGGKLLVDNIPSLNYGGYLTASKGPYFTWAELSSQPGISKIQCLRVDLAGDPSPGWSAAGETVFSSSSDITDPSIGNIRPFYAQLDGPDLILALAGYSPSSIYAIKVTHQHELPWGTTGLLLAENSVSAVGCAPKADGFGILMDGRENERSILLYQSVDSSGNLQHEFPGVLLHTAADWGRLSNISLTVYANEGMLATWKSQNDPNLHYRTLNPLGVPVEANAQTLGELDGSTYFVRPVALNNEAVVVWSLSRAYAAEGYYNGFRGIFAQKVNGMIASNPQGPELIESPLVISSAYPNPFSDTVTLAWTQKGVEPVQISVYNLKGQLVQKLPSGPQGKGEHSLNWNGKDSQGKKAGAGIYFLRAQSGRAIQVKKIVKL